MNNKRRDLLKKMTVSQQFVTQAEDNAKMDKVRSTTDPAGYHDCNRRHFPKKFFLLGKYCEYYVPDVYSTGNFCGSEFCPSSWQYRSFY